MRFENESDFPEDTSFLVRTQDEDGSGLGRNYSGLDELEAKLETLKREDIRILIPDMPGWGSGGPMLGTPGAGGDWTEVVYLINRPKERGLGFDSYELAVASYHVGVRNPIARIRAGDEE